MKSKAVWKEFPLTIEEVRAMIKKEDHKKCTGIAIAIGVIAVLVAVVLWVAKKREKDLEEHYEYFDDDFEDLDENYDEFDESIYDEESDDEDEIEYVKIKDFMNYDDEAETVVEAIEEVAEAIEEADEVNKTEE